MARWIPVPSASEIPPGGARYVKVAGVDLALFHEGGSFFATDDACPHQGGSLGEGTLHRGRVICPWHKWVFDIRDGTCVRVPGIAVRVYPVRVRDWEVEVELPDESGGGESDDRQATG